MIFELNNLRLKEKFIFKLQERVKKVNPWVERFQPNYIFYNLDLNLKLIRI